MPTRKFTEQDIKEIRCMHRKHVHYAGLADVYKVANIASKYGVRPNAIYDILSGVSYGYVPMDYCAEQE